MSPRTAKKPRKRLSADARRELIERSALAVFAERGYHGASMEEIAKRAGVTPPVVYDHFDSKLALHRRLLERTRDELLEMWRTSLSGDQPAEERIPRALDAWAGYVQSHPYAPRMFFMETTGDPEIQQVHRQVSKQALGSLGGILSGTPGGDVVAGSDEARDLEMAAEVIRAGLTGLAIWWSRNPEVPRERIVATAVNVMWVGLERAGRGERWTGPLPEGLEPQGNQGSS